MLVMKHFKILNFPTFTDCRGALTVQQDILPFKVARIYWIYESDGQIRGGHRHKKTQQALVAINGNVSVYMNDGMNAETIRYFKLTEI